MNRIKSILSLVRRQLELPRYRHLVKLLAVAALAGVTALLFWLPDAQSRLDRRATEVAGDLREIQEVLAEIERLKPRALPSRIAGATLQEAVTASLASGGPSLSISLVDADHVRVQGKGGFNAAMRWLGDAQQSHRLGVTSMTASRQGGAIAIDMTLSSGRE